MPSGVVGQETGRALRDEPSYVRQSSSADWMVGFWFPKRRRVFGRE